jgi:non-specific protein-tyrosine kinase
VLATQVDGVILVARFGRTDASPVAESRRRLDVVGATLLGTVLNAVPASSEYVDDYRYTATSPKASRRARRAGRSGAQDSADVGGAAAGGDPASAT